MNKNTIPALIDEAYTHWNNATRLGEIGSELESRSRLPLARKFLRRATELAPDANPEFYVSFAFACFRDVENLSEEGEKFLVDGIEATDSDYLKATYIAHMEDDHIAEEMITQAQYASDNSVLLALARSLHWRGRVEEALNLFRQTIREIDIKDADLGLAGYCSSLIWMKGQGFEINLESEVMPHLKSLIANFPNRYTLRSILINYYQVLQNWEEVCRSSQETIGVFPDEETTMAAMGISLEKLGREDEALMWYSRAIGAKPSFARARIRIGKIYQRRGEIEQAEYFFREIPIAQPKYIMGAVYLSFFLNEIGKIEEAEKFFRESYPKLKPYEKSNVEKHPIGKTMIEKVNVGDDS